MQNVTNNVKTLVNELNPLSIYIYKSATKINNTIKEFKYSQSSGESDEYTIGSCNSAQVTLTLDGSTTLNRDDILNIKWSVQGDTTEYPLITGVIDSIEEKNGSTNIVLYDVIYSCGDIETATTTESTTAFNVLRDTALILGVSVDTNIQTIAQSIVLPHGTSPLGDSVTVATLLSEISALMGGNCIISRENTLTVKTYNSTDFTTNTYLGECDLSKNPFTLTGIAFEVPVEDEEAEETSVTYYAGESPYRTFESNLATENNTAVTWNLIKDTPDYSYGEVGFAGGMLLELGDVITVNDGGKEYTIKCDDMSLSYDGGTKVTIRSYGKEEYTTGGSVTQKIQAVESTVQTVKKESAVAKSVATQAQEDVAVVKANEDIMRLLSNGNQGMFFQDDTGNVYINATYVKALSSHIDSVVAGSLTSDNFKYTKGNFSDLGTSINLDDGTILSPYFSVLGDSAYFSGELQANSGNKDCYVKLGDISITGLEAYVMGDVGSYEGTGLKVINNDDNTDALDIVYDKTQDRSAIYSPKTMELISTGTYLASAGDYLVTNRLNMMNGLKGLSLVSAYKPRGVAGGTKYASVSLRDGRVSIGGTTSIDGTTYTSGAIYTYGKTSADSGSGVVIGDGTIHLQRTGGNFPTIAFHNSTGSKQLNLLVNETDLDKQRAGSVNIYLRPTVGSTATPTFITRRIERGDTIDIRGVYAGHITNSGKRLDFFVPIRDMNTNFNFADQTTAVTFIARHTNGGYAYCQTASSTFRYFNGINLPADMNYTCSFYPNGIRFGLSAVNSNYGTFYRTAATTSAIPNNSPVSVELTTGVIEVGYAVG